MKTLNRVLVALALLLCLGNKLYAQSGTLPNSFLILNNNSPDKEEFYKTSISAADMEQYRLRDQRVRLEFENGFELELYSAKELFVSGQSLNINSYPLSHTGKVPVFGILPGGHLMAKVFTEFKK